MNPSTSIELAGEPPSIKLVKKIDLVDTEMAGECNVSTKIAGEMNSRSEEVASETKGIQSMREINPKDTEIAIESSECTDSTSLRKVGCTPHTELVNKISQFRDRKEYLKYGVPLYEASITGDWETAKVIFSERPELVKFEINTGLNTTLHIAAIAKETKLTLRFVKNLVNMMTREELELKNGASNTAFIIAAINGHVKMAMIMVEKNRRLLDIRGYGERLPLTFCAFNAQYRSLKYLFDNSRKLTGDPWTDDDRIETLQACVNWDFFDVALQILKDRPELGENEENFSYILEVLARKPDSFKRVEKNLISRIIDPIFRFFCMKVQPRAKEEDTNALKLLKIIWSHVVRAMSIDEIIEMIAGSSPILFVAAQMGNTRFILELLRVYPDLMLIRNEDGLTIFHIAVMHRHQGIYNLLYEIGGLRDDICLLADNTGNYMLHLVGKSSKEMAPKTSGASLLMQRELLWFREVEKIMSPTLREEKNNNGQTPYELFSQENEELVSKGLKWMKDCMVVATLIVTVALAVAFTVPGGYDQEHGIPIFIHERTFLVFVIADAVSLFSSSTSLLMFLCILTSRHSQRDFMYSLPRKLMIGSVTLFISVAAMMVTFCASFFVLYHNRLTWLPIIIATFATVPVIVFAILQFPLLVDMFRSMYDSHYLFKPKKHMLFVTKASSCSNDYSSCW